MPNSKSIPWLVAAGFILATFCGSPQKQEKPRAWYQMSAKERSARLFSGIGESPRSIHVGDALLRFIDIGPSTNFEKPTSIKQIRDAGKAADAGLEAPLSDEVRFEPWMFVHGFRGGMGDFGELIIEAGKIRRVIAIDLPGFGGSASLSDNFSIDRYASVLGDFLGAVGVRSVRLVCHSMGGQICIAAALGNAGYVSSLTLIDSAGTYDKDKYVKDITRRFGKVHLGRITTREDRALSDAFVGDGDFLTRFISKNPALLAALDSFHANYRDKVFRIRAPTLIIWGADDPIFPVENAIHLKESIDGAVLHVVEGSGHYPQMTHPERVLDWIVEHDKRISKGEI